MDKLAPANVGVDELPEGFSAINPNATVPGNNEAEFKRHDAASGFPRLTRSTRAKHLRPHSAVH